jgi:hypothetical protein
MKSRRSRAAGRRSVLASLAVVLLPALWAGSASCAREPNAPDSASDVQAFAASCTSAPDASVPTSPEACAGPDADGWSNQPRSADAGPCPPPPDGCTQVVIGRLADTAAYIGCPGYIVLNRSDWTIDLNDQFIACVAACNLGTCDPPVIVVSRSEDIPDFNVDYTQTSVTSRELCELINAGCAVTMADDTGPGLVECGGSKSASHDDPP